MQVPVDAKSAAVKDGPAVEPAVVFVDPLGAADVVDELDEGFVAPFGKVLVEAPVGDSFDAAALQAATAATPTPIAINRKALPEVMAQWERFGEGVPLDVLNTPFRSLIQPVLEYVDRLTEENPERVITVIVPEAVASTWLHSLLQENVANQLKQALGSRPNVVVTNVRYFLD